MAIDQITTGVIKDNAVTAAKIPAGAVDADVGTGAITTAKLAADAVDGTKLADNAVNSEHVTAGSIDLAHLSADSVDGTKIADNAINSEHYTDGSIDTAHIADDQVTGAKIENSPTIAANLTVTGNIIATTPTILVPANKQAILAVNTVADGDGNTRSPIARDGRTWMYYDFGDAAGTGTWANSGVASNVASGRRGAAHGGASYRVSLGANGQRTTTDNLGASYLWTNDNTANDIRVTPGGDPFGINGYGMTMGCCFLPTQTSIGGVIYYGDTDTEDHFFVRTNYDATGRIKLGEDTSGTDSWTIITGSDEAVAARGYWFLCVAQTFPSGDLYASHNGGGWIQVRVGGSTVSPDTTIFGLQGDPYNDNAAKHKYLTAFWSEGFMNESLIWAEWQWLKAKWSNASFAD